MTITVNSSGFTVKNSQGQTKFTSNEKLVYLKYRQINTIPFGGAGFKQTYPFYPVGDKDFFMLLIKFNSSTGNTLDQLLGRWIPANGSIITNFRGYSGGPNGEAVAETKILAAGPSGNGSIGFSQYSSGYGGLTFSPDFVQMSSASGNLTYDARIYSYL